MAGGPIQCEHLGVLSPESCFDILARESITRGQRSAVKEKLRVVVTENGVDRELTVVLKRTTRAEALALRAANQVPGTTAIPRLIRSGCDANGDWIAIPFYAGEAAPTETALPDNVLDSLAAVHAHYLNSTPPEEMPRRDARWWKSRCAQPPLSQLGDPALQPIIDTLRGWESHPLIVKALTELPQTLLHGDVHRNNVVVFAQAGHLIDWGGAAYGIPMLDLITPGPPDSRGYVRYADAWRKLTGESTAAPAWRRGYLTATVCTKVDYLGFVARNYGVAAALGRFDLAARALAELEAA